MEKKMQKEIVRHYHMGPLIIINCGLRINVIAVVVDTFESFEK